MWEHATRVGSLALLISSTTSLLAAILLPYLIQPSPSKLVSEYRNTADRRNWNDFTVSWLSMRRLWVISSLLFAISMFSTIFISSTFGTIILFGIVGISWAVASWIPYTFLSLEISNSYTSPRIQGGLFKRNEGQVGVILGLHNIAICIPQIIISLGSSFLWKAQEDSPQPNADTTSWVLRTGGAGALVASWLIIKNIQDP